MNGGYEYTPRQDPKSARFTWSSFIRMFSLKSLLKSRYLRFDVSVENAVLVHMIDGFEDLIHQESHSVLGQIVTSSLDGFIHVHVHQFEYECQSSRGLVTTHFS